MNMEKSQFFPILLQEILYESCNALQVLFALITHILPLFVKPSIYNIKYKFRITQVETVCEVAVQDNLYTLLTDTAVKEKKKSKKPTLHLQSDIYCPKCGAHFLSYYDYDKHVLGNPLHNSFQCCMCKKTSKSWYDLRVHCQCVHGMAEYCRVEKTNPQNWFCHFCGHKETLIQEIERHVNDKHPRWALKCLLCPEVCQHPQILFSHFELQHSLVNNVDLQCDQCKYRFYDPFAYNLHMSKVHDVSTISYQCVLCPKTLIGMSSFILHVHEHSNYSVSDPSSMKQLRMVNGRPMYSIWKKQCLVCAEIYSEREQLNIHMTTVHFNSLKCPLCSDSNITNMDLHLMRKHALFLNLKGLSEKNSESNKIAKKVCEICYGLIDSSTMTRHMKDHETKGSKRFKSRNPLVDSIPDQKQCTKCDQCHLKVVTTFLKWHHRVHAKESKDQEPRRPSRRKESRLRDELKCTECDRCYDTAENLINHVKAQHFMNQTVTRPFHGFMRMPRPGGFMHPFQMFQQRFQSMLPQGQQSPGRGGYSRGFSG